MGAGADAKAVEIAGSKPALDLSRSVYILSFRLIEAGLGSSDSGADPAPGSRAFFKTEPEPNACA
jgi:hypothetical protein